VGGGGGCLERGLKGCGIQDMRLILKIVDDWWSSQVHVRNYAFAAVVSMDICLQLARHRRTSVLR
jgi:hypothetical protein